MLLIDSELGCALKVANAVSHGHLELRTALIQNTVCDENIEEILSHIDTPILHEAFSKDDIDRQRMAIRDQLIENERDGRKIQVIVPVILSPELYPLHVLLYQKIHRLIEVGCDVIIIALDRMVKQHITISSDYRDIDTMLNLHRSLLKALGVEQAIEIVLESQLADFLSANPRMHGYLLGFNMGEYYKNTVGTGLYKYPNMTPKLVDIESLFNIILFCFYPLPGHEKADFILTGMDKQPSISSILSYLDKDDYFKEQMKTVLLYLPQMDCFFKMRAGGKEKALPRHTDSIEIIKRKLAHAATDELISLATIHNSYLRNETAPRIRTTSEEINQSLSEFYFDIFKRSNELLKNACDVSGEVLQTYDSGKIIGISKCLSEPACIDVLRAINAIERFGSEPTPIAISRYLKKGLSTVLSQLKRLEDARLVVPIKKEMHGRGRGQMKYSITCKKIELHLNLQDIITASLWKDESDE